VCRKSIFLIALFACACTRLDTLTPELLNQSQEKWKAHQPVAYHLVIEMSGDRVQTGKFEVMVRAGQVVSLRRNGLIITPGSGQDYSMDGLLRMLMQELGLAEKPALLGAPGGYSAYLQARFDPDNGRLILYRRSVGGTSNSIDVRVTEYEPNAG
jgi:hypothetical protein